VRSQELNSLVLTSQRVSGLTMTRRLAKRLALRMSNGRYDDLDGTDDEHELRVRFMSVEDEARLQL
jgi:hypothetical protein